MTRVLPAAAALLTATALSACGGAPALSSATLPAATTSTTAAPSSGPAPSGSSAPSPSARTPTVPYGETLDHFGVGLTLSRPATKPYAKPPASGETSYELITVTAKNAEGDEPLRPSHFRFRPVTRDGQAIPLVTADPALVPAQTTDTPLGQSTTFSFGVAAKPGAQFLVGVFYDTVLFAVVTPRNDT